MFRHWTRKCKEFRLDWDRVIWKTALFARGGNLVNLVHSGFDKFFLVPVKIEKGSSLEVDGRSRESIQNVNEESKKVAEVTQLKRTLPLRTTCDAFENGLGAALQQCENNPWDLFLIFTRIWKEIFYKLFRIITSSVACRTFEKLRERNKFSCWIQSQSTTECPER